ncbi:hypothetical protein AA0114_g3835 [Alternaria tenuissima]|uniref:Uncharacterized protein n=1 Tax=Alternaria tenuissima TaxID=119927 RepID=A0A4Q4MLN1_9PLEO|nr:hypothetical protein AALT_g10246 [Alternaria alternata]RYN54483.1 hypothetical protein AA0114_g3835 [Alternaria tenuissima]
MTPTPTPPGHGLSHRHTFPAKLEPRQGETPSSTSPRPHFFRDQPNENISSSRTDPRIPGAAGLFTQTSHRSITETPDQRGRQRPTASRSVNSIDAQIQAPIMPHNSQSHNSQHGILHVVHWPHSTQTLALATQTTQSIDDRTPTAESPQMYQDDIHMRLSRTGSSASEMSEMEWHMGPF